MNPGMVLQRVFGPEIAEALPVEWAVGSPARCETLPGGSSRILLPEEKDPRLRRAMVLHEAGHAVCHYLWTDRTPGVSLDNAELAAWIPVAAMDTPLGFRDGNPYMGRALRLLRDWGMALGVVGVMERCYRTGEDHEAG